MKAACQCELHTPLQKHTLTNLVSKGHPPEVCRRASFFEHALFVDDGFSGVSFDREGLQAMLQEVEAGHVATVITKDLSRLGRNYLKTGELIEVIFPEYDVRYIAINDGVDTAREDNEFTPLRNWFNVLFCFSTVFANGIKTHSIAKAPVTVSLRERRLQVLFLFRCCL